MRGRIWVFFAVAFLIACSFYSIQSLIGPSYFPMHDGTQVARVIVMGNALRDGQFPVRWVSDLGYGYGYPIFNFYGPLPYYFGGSLYAVGIDAVTATKIMFGAGALAAGIAMFLFVKEIFGGIEALVAACFYIYAPYHAVQIYIRGAVGEYYILAFLPLYVWGIWKAIKEKEPEFFPIGALGLAGIILSHTLLGYVTVILSAIGIFLYFLYRILKKTEWQKQSKNLLGLLFVGLLLSAFFWLPAVTEMKYTNVASQIGGNADFKNHFVCLGQLWDSPWGFAGSGPGCIDGMSFRLGKLHVIAAIISIILLFFRKKLLSEKVLLLNISILILFIALFFTLSFSNFIWQIIPEFEFVQYPWRFLTYAVFSLSVLSGAALTFIQSRITKISIGVICIAFAVFYYAKLFRPQTLYVRPTAEFASMSDLRWRVSKISDEYLPKEVKRPNMESDIVHNTIPFDIDLKTKTEVDIGTYVRYTIESSHDKEVTIQKAFFPGWHYKVNGQNTFLRLDNGLPVLAFKKGTNVVELFFENTGVRLIGNTVSFLSAFALLYFYGRKTIS